MLVIMVAVVAMAASLFYTRLSLIHPLQPVAVNLPDASVIYSINNSYLIQLRFAVRPGAAASVCGLTVIYNASDAATLFPLSSGNNTFVGPNGAAGYVYIKETFIDRPTSEFMIVGFSRPANLTALVFAFCPPGSSRPAWTQEVDIGATVNATSP